MNPKKDRVIELAAIIYGQVEFSLPLQVEESIPFAPDYDPVDHVDTEPRIHSQNAANVLNTNF